MNKANEKRINYQRDDPSNTNIILNGTFDLNISYL